MRNCHRQHHFLAFIVTILLGTCLPTSAVGAPDLFQYHDRLTGDPARGEAIGEHHAIAASGEWLMVGAGQRFTGEHQSGLLYVYRLDVDGQWRIHQRIPAPPRSGFFGFTTVAVEGDTMMFGARSITHAGVDGSSHGAVFVYILDPGTGLWEFDQELQASDPASNDRFGQQVAIHDGIAVIASLSSETPHHTRGGALHVFEPDTETGTWIETQRVFANGSVGISNFALDGDHLAVGSHTVAVDGIPSVGSVFTFQRGTDGIYHQTATIVPPEPANSRSFGRAIALRDGELLIGDPRGVTDGTETGAAWLYRMGDDGDWSLVQRLTPEFMIVPHEPQRAPRFGSVVAISDNSLFVAAPLLRFAVDLRDNDSDRLAVGVVHVYHRLDETDTVALHQIIAPPDAGLTNWSKFGSGIHMHGSQLLIGSAGATVDQLFDSGAIYIMEPTDLEPIDLVTRVEVLPTVVDAGEEASFIITVTNQSSETTAHDVVVRTPIQVNFPGVTEAMEFVWASTNCVLEESGELDTVVCDFASIPPGAFRVASLTVRIDSAVKIGSTGMSTLFATALAREPEPNTANNTFARAVEVILPEPPPDQAVPEYPPRRSGRGALSLWMLLALSGLAAWRHTALRRAAAPLSRAPGGA